ncbi:hypothetical protein ACLOJK_028739 [Asimina triloba]
MLILLIAHPLSLIDSQERDLHYPNLQEPRPPHRPISLLSQLPLHRWSCVSLSRLNSLFIASPARLFLFRFCLENQLKAPSSIQLLERKKIDTIGVLVEHNLNNLQFSPLQNGCLIKRPLVNDSKSPGTHFNKSLEIISKQIDVNSYSQSSSGNPCHSDFLSPNVHKGMHDPNLIPQALQITRERVGAFGNTDIQNSTLAKGKAKGLKESTGKGKEKTRNVPVKKKQKVEKKAKHSLGSNLYFCGQIEEVTYKARFESKPLVKSRRLILDDFLEFPFDKWLQEHGLGEFAAVEEIIYSRLGKEIEIGPSMFEKVYHIPYYANMYIDFTATKQEIFQTLGRNPKTRGGAHRLSSQSLRTMDMRFLHYVCVYHLFPRSGSYTDVTITDAYLLHAHEKGEEYNFAYHMLGHMCKCRRRKNCALPYGMTITKILQYHGVDFTREEQIKYKEADTIDINVMSKLGYVYDNVERQWEPKEAIHDSEDENESEDNAVQQHEDRDDRHQKERVDHDDPLSTGVVEGQVGDVGGNEKDTTSTVMHLTLSSEFSQLRKDIMKYISTCLLAQLHRSPPHPSHAVDTIPQVHPSPSLLTPTPVVSTPIVTLSNTVRLPSPFVTPTVVLKTASGIGERPFSPRTVFSHVHARTSSTTFVDLPTKDEHADCPPQYDPIVYPFPSLPTPIEHNVVLTNEHVLHMTRHNMFLTASIERLITVVDGLSHRIDACMDSFEKRLDDLCSKKASIHGVKGGKPSSD